jgi:S1-C subfamily serine protease
MLRIHYAPYRLLALILCMTMVLAGCGLDLGLQPALNRTEVAEQPSPTAVPPTPLVEQQTNEDNVVEAQLPQPTPTTLPNDDAGLSDYERVVNNVYERNIDAVVNLSFRGGTGSGFIIDDQGHIVTNNHVVENMQQIRVTFADGSTAEGQQVGTYPEGDIAVVRVDNLPAGIQPVELGDSSQVRVGQITVAIGSPLGLQQTVTSGIVSALNRSIQDLGETDPNSSLHGLIQTDASINPGNSGGPLFNSRGQVIGMNTLIASPTRGNIGLGFAVPVNRIKRVARQLIETGTYQRPLINATIMPVETLISLGLEPPVNTGIMIDQVIPGGAADRAGLRGATEYVQVQSFTGGIIEVPVDGDIIIEVNNQPIRTLGDLRNVLETESDPGDTITVTFVRDGREQQTQVTLSGE